MKKNICLLILLISVFNMRAQVPSNYYDSAIGLTGSPLKSELHNIITNGHNPISYNAVWNAFGKTDVYPYPDNNTIWDMYSDVPGGTAAYYYDLGNDQCGTFNQEGDCYNREHSFPKAWWGGNKDKNDDENDPTKYSTQYSDLNQLVAADGFVNQKRGSYAFGEVEYTNWTSTNGSKLGTNTSVYGSSWTVFEPIDEYKGDFARALFYMATRYDVAAWRQNNPGTDIVYVFNTDGSFRQEYYDMIYQWHLDDPVSQKELDRNDEVYNKQHNANPYINHPEWVCEVFGVCTPNPEPDNYPTSFAATATGSSSISLSWTEATGTNLPDAYLIKANTNGSFTDPVDGNEPNEDTDLSDGSAVVKVPYNSGAAYDFDNLSPQTTYYFKIWSYANDGADIDFKTSPAAPQTNATTPSASASACEDFDSGLPSSYTTGDVTLNSGTWHLNQVYREQASNSRGGTGAAARINDDKAGAHLRSPAMNTVGNVSFWYRELNSGGGTFILQKSYDNSNWTNITSQNYSGNTYTQFSYDVNDNNNPVYIRILSDNNPGHLIIDDFCWTAMSTLNSAASDIVRSSAFSEAENILYANYQATDIQNGSDDIEVARFTLRDGGAAGNDADSDPTVLTNITFSLTADSLIRRIALYQGNNELGELDGAATLNFTGFNITAADDDEQDFSLRASFTTTVADHAQFQITITSATASPSGSDFAAGNAGGAASDTTGNRNRLNVLADRLAISTSASANVNTNFTVSLTATDIFGNTDTDRTELAQLSLYTGNGTLSAASGLSQNLLQGEYTWTDVQYDVEESISILGQSGTLTDAISNNINILSNGGLFISEVADPKDSYKYRFVELYNASSAAVDLAAGNYYLTKQSNGGNYADIALTGSIAAHSAFVIAYNANEFQNAYGFAADQVSSSISGNGNDAYLLYENGNHSNGNLVDIYGVENQNGSGKAWEYTDGHAVRKRNINQPATNWESGEWIILTIANGSGANSDQMTPARHKTSLQWTGNSSTDWNTRNNWSTSWVPDASDIVEIATANNKPRITEDAMVYDLSISPQMHLTNNASHFEIGGTLLLESDADGTAGFIDNESRTADIQTYLKAGEWHLVAPPVAGDDSGTLTGVYLKQFNENDSTWSYIVSTNFALENGKSYFAWADASTGDFTATHHGEIVVSDKNISLQYTSPNPHPGGKGWNMIGNPFSSGLLFNADWTFHNAGQTIYAWDQSSGNYKSINTSGIGTLDSIVSTGQGFWIRVTGSGAYVNIPAANRRQTDNVFLKESPQYDENEFHFRISGNAYDDEMILAFRPDASEGFDAAYDAYKLFGKQAAPQLYFVQKGEKLSVNVLPRRQDVEAVVFTGKAGNYTLSMLSGETQKEVWIKDPENHKTLNISKQDYTFTAQENETRHLRISFAKPEKPEEENGKHFQVFVRNGVLHIQSGDLPQADLFIYSLFGQKILTHHICQAETIIPLNIAENYVLVKIISSRGVEVHKVLVKK